MARRRNSRSANTGRYAKSNANGKVAYKVARSSFGVTKIKRDKKSS